MRVGRLSPSNYCSSANPRKKMRVGEVSTRCAVTPAVHPIDVSSGLQSVMSQHCRPHDDAELGS